VSRAAVEVVVVVNGDGDVNCGRKTGSSVASVGLVAAVDEHRAADDVAAHVAVHDHVNDHVLAGRR